MRTVRQYDEWTSKLDKIHNKLEKHALNGVSFVDTMSSQVPLSERRGGLGLRPPSLFHIDRFFKILLKKMANSP